MSNVKFQAVDGVFAEIDTDFVSDWAINEPAENTDEGPILDIAMVRDHDGRPRQRLQVAGCAAYVVALALLMSSAQRNGVTPIATPYGLHFQPNGGAA